MINVDRLRNRPCIKCIEEKQRNPFWIVKLATEWHHMFSQTKWARELYSNLLDREENGQPLCYYHHHNAPLDKLSETEFCERLNIKPRSKQYGNTTFTKRKSRKRATKPEGSFFKDKASTAKKSRVKKTRATKAIINRSRNS